MKEEGQEGSLEKHTRLSKCLEQTCKLLRYKIPRRKYMLFQHLVDLRKRSIISVNGSFDVLSDKNRFNSRTVTSKSTILEVLSTNNDPVTGHKQGAKQDHESHGGVASSLVTSKIDSKFGLLLYELTAKETRLFKESIQLLRST
jgi:hypothetical protein